MATSKGAGDLCYRAISALNDPGIVVHGVALKPGKPLIGKSALFRFVFDQDGIFAHPPAE